MENKDSQSPAGETQAGSVSGAELAAQYRRVTERVFARYVEYFPTYAWTDDATAVDLMAAEIHSLRRERDELVKMLLRGRQVIDRPAWKPGETDREWFFSAGDLLANLRAIEPDVEIGAIRQIAETPREWRFDRYRRGILMAQGVCVHA